MRLVAAVALLLTLHGASFSGPLAKAASQGGGEASAPQKLLVMRTLDLDHAPVQGGCFTVTALDGPDWERSVCDDDPGDNGQRPGWVIIDIPSTPTAVSVALDVVPASYQLVGKPFVDRLVGKPFVDRVELTGTDRTSVDFVVASPEQRASDIPTPLAAVAACELVEIYPGYPSYQGYITGLDGIGDHACLENLIALDPGFDRASEDRENFKAAKRLGVAGSPRDWTWENWMAIEAERGMAPTCYSCAIANAPYRAEPTGTDVAWNDPRLLIGSYGTTIAVDLLLPMHQPGPRSLRTLLPYDHDLRALVGLVYAGQHLNATETLAGYETVVDGLMQGAWWPNPQVGYENILSQGGYAPTPPSANPQDQVFMARVGVEPLARAMDPMFGNAFRAGFNNNANAWLASTLVSGLVLETSLGEWLQNASDQGAP